MLRRILAVFIVAFSAGALAQPWPARPIRMIVPFAAGGGTDIVARTVAPRMGEALGQTMVVDNRAGANANIGFELAARAAPDGYTVIMGSSALTINPGIYRKLPFDPIRDFAPISLATAIPYLLVVHPGVPASSVRELVALAQSKRIPLNYGSAGTGNGTHLAMELLKTMAGIDIVHIPYKGTGQSLTDVIAGQVQLIFGSIPSTQPHVRGGRLRALAVSGAKRSTAIPDVPTVAESGVPGYELQSWFGLLAPAGTPPVIVTRLHAELARALAHAEVHARLAGEGAEPVGNTPAEFAEYLRTDLGKYAKIVKAARIAMDH